MIAGATSQQTIIALDWSSRSKPSPKAPVADAIYSCLGRADSGIQAPQYHRTRQAAFDYLVGVIDSELDQGRQVILGADFAFGYPIGTAQKLCHSSDPLALWDVLETRIKDAPNNGNNRFSVAAGLNDHFDGIGPFWGCPAQVTHASLPHKGNDRHGHGMAEYRLCDSQTRSAQSVWKLFTTGSVGSQTLLGLPMLNRLRARFAGRSTVWPFQEDVDAELIIVEIYPSLYDLDDVPNDGIMAIKDARQVYRVVQEFLETDVLAHTLSADIGSAQIRQEGWIMGVPLPKDAIC